MGVGVIVTVGVIVIVGVGVGVGSAVAVGYGFDVGVGVGTSVAVGNGVGAGEAASFNTKSEAVAELPPPFTYNALLPALKGGTNINASKKPSVETRGRLTGITEIPAMVISSRFASGGYPIPTTDISSPG